MSLANTKLLVSENITQVTEVSTNQVTLNVVAEVSTIPVDFVLPVSTSEEFIFTPYKNIGSTNLQGALNEFADEVGVKRQNAEPSSYVNGDLWYDLDDNQLKVARYQNGSLTFIPLLSADPDMDTLNGGDFV